MPLVAMVLGQLASLDALLAALGIRVFPYQNDRVPRVNDLRGAYTEADFSGYGGRKVATNWTPAVYSNFHAYSQADSMLWLQNGGGTSNNIYGVCYVDALDKLLFAERDPRAPVLVDGTHRQYAYRPIMTDTAEFSP